MDNQTTRRRCFQFRLRTLLPIVTLLAIVFAWLGPELQQRREHRVALTWVEANGGRAVFDSLDKGVRAITFHDSPVNDLSHITCFTDLESLFLLDTPVSDLSPLAQLAHLRRLTIRDTRVHDLTPLKTMRQLKELNVEYVQLFDAEIFEPYQIMQIDGPEPPTADRIRLLNLEEELHTLALEAEVLSLRNALPHCRITPSVSRRAK